MKAAPKFPAGVPELECDIVMRGGVVSGLVYPSAVAEIAQLYRLRSIGGTSAGALAAAGAAAMEFGRVSGRNLDALHGMRAIPGDLAAVVDGCTRLASLIEPEGPTRPIYDLLVGAMEAKGRRGFLKLLAMVWPLAGPPALWTWLLVAGLAAAGLQLLNPAGGPGGWAEHGALALLIGALAAAAVALLRIIRWGSTMLDAVVANGYGISAGWKKPRRPDADRGAAGAAPPSLMRWAHETIQGLAGLPEDEPLTFGDLWAARHRRPGVARDDAFAAARRERKRADDDDLASCPRQIDLTLITTNLNRGQLVQLPFLNEPHFVRISDLERLLPASVVRWMVRRGGRDRRGHDGDGEEFIRLPAPEDLPVLFATRLSLSFPILFSAVPLFVDRETEQGFERVQTWLSDGGITSNMPIHLFDSPIPARPTLCLNLVYHGDELGTGEPGDEEEGDAETCLRTGDPARPERKKFLYMPNSKDGRIGLLRRIKGDSAFSRISQFVGLILSAARFWNDNMTMDAPGYRERIIHIWMDKEDSAFDFRLKPERIRRLEEKGRKAGAAIARRFLPDQQDDPLRPGKKLQLTWTNHRFTRLRAFLAAMEIVTDRFSGVLKKEKEEPGEQTRPELLELLETAGNGQPKSPTVDFPPKDKAQRDLLTDMTKSVQQLSILSGKNGAQADFVAGEATSPRPKTALRARPQFDSDPLAVMRRN